MYLNKNFLLGYILVLINVQLSMLLNEQKKHLSVYII